MSDVVYRRGGGGSPLTLALLLLVSAAFGAVSGLPDYLGPAIGAAGALASELVRRYRPEVGRTLALGPELAALGALAVTAAPVPSTELLGSLSSLALLLWVADDPQRAPGGGRRAVPTLAVCATAVGVVFGLSLALGSAPPGVGVAGGLLAFVVLFLAVLLERLTLVPPGRAARA